MDEKASQMLLACMRDVGQNLLKVGETLINYAKSNGSLSVSLTPGQTAGVNLAATQGLAPMMSPILPATVVPADGTSGGQTVIAGGIPYVSDFKFSQKRKGDDKADRAPKRIRMNWTDEENEIVVKVVREGKHLTERELLSTMMDKLGGTRNLTQCKNHFRNLLRAGKVDWSGGIKPDSPLKAGSDGANEAAPDIPKDLVDVEEIEAGKDK
mmetsp:Transcript_8983/g.26995  ORF Transcript_8983/g.26995 Transcript_8983/m.26995 type:complete len:211 (+) Transcript_8983:206-838(+)